MQNQSKIHKGYSDVLYDPILHLRLRFVAFLAECAQILLVEGIGAHLQRNHVIHLQVAAAPADRAAIAVPRKHVLAHHVPGVVALEFAPTLVRAIMAETFGNEIAAVAAKLAIRSPFIDIGAEQRITHAR